MVAIMGPSGSGKSTILYAASGMDRSIARTVLFDGKDMMKLKEKELAELRLNKILQCSTTLYCQRKRVKRMMKQKKQKVERAEVLMRKMGIMM